jgi:hypothetical protein
VVIEDSLVTANTGGGVNSVQPGNLTIRRSTILANPLGVGLYNDAGSTATLETTTISGHTFGGGSGITNRAMLTVRANSVISDNVVNSGNGGSAIWNAGSQANVQIFDSTIRNNRTTNPNFTAAAAIYNLAGGRMTITDSVIAENIGGTFGGGILNNCNAGQLTISRCTIRDNRVLSPFGQGIGLMTLSTCVITDTLFRGNVGGSSSRGGGLSFSGGAPLTLRDCTFVNNQAANGSAIHVSGMATIERCAFHGNTSGVQFGDVGGAVVLGSPTTMTNCTISGNLGNPGGGLDTGQGPSLTNVTIFGNNGIGLTIRTSFGTPVSLRNTIVAGNTGPECAVSGPMTTLGNNIAGDGTCGLTDPTDLPNTDPLLGPLAANGGLSLTHRLRLGSPAIDAANAAACPNHDQRSFARPADGDNNGTIQCDIGAYEQQLADCDNNGVFDLTDISAGTWPDSNDNGVPDNCEVVGDIDGNGVVDLADYARFPRCFDGPGAAAVSICTRADADGDGDVDLLDFADVQMVFGGTP